MGVVRRLEKMERRRQTAEQNMYRQACREMAGITSFVTREFRARVAESMSDRHEGPLAFGAMSMDAHLHSGLPAAMQVRVDAARRWPSISDFIEDLQRRRDASEDAVRSRIFELEVRLLKEENRLVAEALESLP